jgi:hypothetical protein
MSPTKTLKIEFVLPVLIKQKIDAFHFCPPVAKRKKKLKGPPNLLFASLLKLK